MTTNETSTINAITRTICDLITRNKVTNQETNCVRAWEQLGTVLWGAVEQTCGVLTLITMVLLLMMVVVFVLMMTIVLLLMMTMVLLLMMMVVFVLIDDDVHVG